MLKGRAARGEEVGGILLIPWDTISSVLREHFCLICSHTRTSFYFSACSVIVLVSRKQKSSIGDNNFVTRKGTFQSNWPKWPDRSKRTTFKAGPEYASQSKPNESVPFDVPTKISRILGWMEKGPSFSVFRNFPASCWKMEGNQLIDHKQGVRCAI